MEQETKQADLERVRWSAQLARLALDERRADALAGEIGAILEHFRVLSQVDVTGVEPLLRPAVPSAGPRCDEVRPSLAREILLAAAPEAHEGFYVVPLTVLQEGGPSACAPSGGGA